MGRAGRLQGDPRGETAEANALAVFLRDITKGRTVRELARCYGSGKTTWSDYRSGVKIIPWAVLVRVVSSRVRDERGRTELLARAQRLHVAACAAEGGAGHPVGHGPGDNEAAELLRAAQRRVDAQLAESEGVVRRLLGLTARLQSELDDALRRAEDNTAGETAPSAGAAPLTGLEPTRVDTNLDGAGPPVWEHAAVSPRQDAPADESAGTRREPLDTESEACQGAPGGAIVLRGLRRSMSRHDSNAPRRIGAGVEIRRVYLPQLPTEAAPPAVREARVVRGQVVRRADHASGGRGLVVVRQRALAHVPLSPGWLRRVLLIVCVILALGVTATGVDHAPWPRPGSAAPSPPGPVTEAAPPALAPTPAPQIRVPEASSEPPRSGPSPRLPAPASTLAPSTPTPDTKPPAARRPAQVPSSAGSGVYAIAADGRAVVQWSGKDMAWVTIGGPAKELYAGRAGVFATDARSGELRVYGGAPGAWETVSEPGAAFAISGTDLYRLAQDRSAVHRWDRAARTWTRVGGPAARLYGGGAGLFATDPVDGRIFAYTGKGDAWTYAGAAGADFAVSDDHLYGLNPERSGVFRWSGEPGVWSAVGGPAGAVYASPSDLYASNEADGGLWRYRAGGWTRIGEAGVGFGAQGDRVYRLDKDRAAVWEWAGADWRRIGGPVRTLVVAN
ncbi:hypothetical protein BX283_7532 [Streptomyces sp. TLI_146]|nr:hypothetical protein BX283_7532 [Streptomyces sp. TLI_146]